MYSRTERVIGSENVEKLKSLNIAVLGLGGVGGYVVEMFARVGVGALTIIDFDKGTSQRRCTFVTIKINLMF